MNLTFKKSIRLNNSVAPVDNPLIKSLKKNYLLYIMLIPGLTFFLTFRYLPMLGLSISFMDYQPYLGVSGSEWVGLKHFQRFFSDPIFFKLFRNTLWLALLNLVFYFPIPIILSLLLNEVRNRVLKRSVQSCIYLPHFLSWVVVVSLTQMLFDSNSGIVNIIKESMGLEAFNPMLSTEWFRFTVLMQIVWKEAGWGTIIFLAALSGVNQSLYEAAYIDGANRWKQTWHITLPSIRGTIITMFILRLGQFMNLGFAQMLLMVNAITRDLGEIFDTYVYELGIRGGQFSYTTAIGLFKSGISLVLVIIANKWAKKIGEDGIY